jgi:hypothetical protein
MHGPAEGEAKLRYGMNEFEVVRPGHFVRCAVTGVRIPLADLSYWNAEVQEPYASAEIAQARAKELGEADPS